MGKQFYETLGLDQGCTREDIKKSYRRLAIKHHPDKEGGDAEEFKKLGAAYAVLSDEATRAKYDQLGDSAWAQHEQGHGHSPGHDPAFGMTPMDVFAQMFGGMGMGRGPAQAHAPQQVRRVDHSHTVAVTLREAFHGVTRILRVSLPATCLACTEDCGECNGAGLVVRVHTNGPFQHAVRVRCEACVGAGIRTCPRSCEQCGGVGMLEKTRDLTFVIPPGSKTGRSKRFTGCGEQRKRAGETSGDLVVEIRVDEDPGFRRDGDDLHHTIDISLWESITGKIVTVPMFDGEVTIDTRELGTGVVEPGKRYAQGGGGMPIEGQGSRGALLLSFVVAYPDSRLDDETRQRLLSALSLTPPPA